MHTCVIGLFYLLKSASTPLTSNGWKNEIGVESRQWTLLFSHKLEWRSIMIGSITRLPSSLVTRFSSPSPQASNPVIASPIMFLRSCRSVESARSLFSIPSADSLISSTSPSHGTSIPSSLLYTWSILNQINTVAT